MEKKDEKGPRHTWQVGFKKSSARRPKKEGRGQPAAWGERVRTKVKEEREKGTLEKKKSNDRIGGGKKTERGGESEDSLSVLSERGRLPGGMRKG